MFINYITITFFYEKKMNKLNKIEYQEYYNLSTKKVTRYLYIRFTHFRGNYANKVLWKRLIY